MLNPSSALTRSVKSKYLQTMYTSFIISRLEYGSILFHSASQAQISKLDKVHYRAALIVSGCLLIHGSNHAKVF
jgi:hypothetical protein